MKEYLILLPYLPEGHYMTHGKLNWHEKLRIKLAKWLFKSIPKHQPLDVKITTGPELKNLRQNIVELHK